MDRKSCEGWRVALLAGGDSPEREVSLASGRQAASALRAGGHQVAQFDPAEQVLERIAWEKFDVCFLALHGGAGEDGRVQAWLERRAIPYTGSGPAASRLAMHKSEAKRRLRAAGVPTPDWVLLKPDLTSEQEARLASGIPGPLVVKPNAQGSSLGVSLVEKLDRLPAAVAEARRFDPLVLVERFVAGRELTVALLGREALPVIEIVRPGVLFDYHAKYSSTATGYEFAGDLRPIKLQEVQQVAAAAAETLHTRGLVRVDLILDHHQRPWVLEVNTLPGMTEHSLVPKAAARAGLSMTELCNWMLRDALERVRSIGRSAGKAA